MNKTVRPATQAEGKPEPLVSVVVPVYNSSQFIRKCLESILAQTYRNIEIIIVNDGSTDNSSEIINDIKQENPNIIVINQRNSGGVIARKNGIKRATGEYVLLEDSDDWLDNDLIEKCVNVVKKDKTIDIVKFGFITEPSKEKRNPLLEGIIKQGTLAGDEINAVLKRLLYSSDCNNVWNEMVRKSLYDFDDKIYKHIVHKGEDAQINLQIWQKAKKAVFLEDCPYHYTDNPDGITNSFNAQKVVNDVKDSIYLDEVKKAIALERFGVVDESALANRIMIILSSKIIRILAFSKNPRADMLFIQTSLGGSLKKYADNYDASSIRQSYLCKRLFINAASGHNMKNMKYKTICKLLMRTGRGK